ncbi:hypothetical protein [Streptomyces pactum]|uniref:hypothetical protein n=1 Tax=Streptomyces pactum TaxID=68249 RepID=UPI001E4F028E|nr:hypothetical protein [Streptomyces pactum]
MSLSDPALAVKKAVLWPLLGAAEPPLERAEKLVVMLAAAPGSTVTPEDLERLATARRTLRSMLPANVARPVELDIRGTVSVDSAMTDPVGALHRALLRPLLDTLVGVLKNIETVMGMLMAVPVPGITTADVEAIRGARSVLEAQLSLAGADPARATGTAAAAPDDHPEPAPGTGARTSIRLAVEEALTSVVEPFAVKDVLRVLVERLGYSPLLYRDLGKSVSNVLSNMVRAGTLTRVSRGTYVRPRNPAAGTIPRQGVPTHE